MTEAWLVDNRGRDLTAEIQRALPVRDEPIDGVNICVEGCILEPPYKQHVDLDACPDCGADVVRNR